MRTLTANRTRLKVNVLILAEKILLTAFASGLFLTATVNAHQTKARFSGWSDASAKGANDPELLEIPRLAIMALIGFGLLGIGTLLRHRESGKQNNSLSSEAGESLTPVPPMTATAERTSESVPQRVRSATNSQ
jgi:hypothetical protein